VELKAKEELETKANLLKAELIEKRKQELIEIEKKKRIEAKENEIKEQEEIRRKQILIATIRAQKVEEAKKKKFNPTKKGRIAP